MGLIALLRKATYCSFLNDLEQFMATLTVSSKGQIVLPAGIRRRLGLGAGAKIEIVEEAGELRLRVVSAVNQARVVVRHFRSGTGQARGEGICTACD